MDTYGKCRINKPLMPIIIQLGCCWEEATCCEARFSNLPSSTAYKHLGNKLIPSPPHGKRLIEPLDCFQACNKLHWLIGSNLLLIHSIYNSRWDSFLPSRLLLSFAFVLILSWQINRYFSRLLESHSNACNDSNENKMDASFAHLNIEVLINSHKCFIQFSRVIPHAFVMLLLMEKTWL